MDSEEGSMDQESYGRESKSERCANASLFVCYMRGMNSPLSFTNDLYFTMGEANIRLCDIYVSN